MTAGLDERRPDHTRPTIAFIVLAVTAAAVMTAGMTTSDPETPLAADRPVRLTPAVPVPTTEPAPAPPVLPEFSMADVVTLAAAEVEPAPGAKRTNPARTGSGSSSVAGAGSRTTSGSRTTTTGPGTGSGSGGSGGHTGGSRSDLKDPGPGRSTTGQGHARGQKDATPGRGGSPRRTARVTGRR